MIKVEHLSYGFPQKDLFHDITFTLEEGQHCAFIGTSGSGKSTLAQMIRHPEPFMYEGKLETLPSSKIGYVNQFFDRSNLSTTAVFDYIASYGIKLQNELTDICTQMETATELEPLLDAYQDTLDAYDAIGGDQFESLIEKKLYLANLSDRKKLPLTALSGGEFKLVQIIKEMLTHPALLIMDEPDVFLDFENLGALKNLINAHKGTLLVITHNRYLLGNCFDKILHLENKELQEYDGNYTAYHAALLERKIELQELAAADTEEIKRNEALIERLRTAATDHDAPSRGKSLKARLKIQERLEKRRIKAPFVDIKEPTISLETHHPLEEGNILEVHGLSIAFDTPLLEDIEFEIGAHDKVALIGPNGTGKSTLLRAIYKRQNPEITYHPETEMAYVSQLENETLDEEKTLLETFLGEALKTSDEVYSYLEGYGFHEEMMTERIKNLSGGEKNLLQLAKIARHDANLLLLDEPTSHLDTYAQVALEKAIQSYNGAILMISHDFYSIAHCMDYILYIDDHHIRRVSMRKFRKMIYARYFDKDYLEIEQKKKELELKIAKALKAEDFLQAKNLFEALKPLIPSYI